MRLKVILEVEMDFDTKRLTKKQKEWYKEATRLFVRKHLVPGEPRIDSRFRYRFLEPKLQGKQDGNSRRSD